MKDGEVTIRVKQIRNKRTETSTEGSQKTRRNSVSKISEIDPSGYKPEEVYTKGK